MTEVDRFTLADQFSEKELGEIFRAGAVGIDLGTTYSAVAAISDAGRVEILVNSDGALTTPSVVLFDAEGDTLVGDQAKNVGQGQAERVVECVKRVMGDPEIAYEIAGQTYTPEGISAIILGKLVKDASERLGREVKSAVITVPAWFNDDARQATLRAGQAAGLHVLGILSEPSAAALAYGLGGQKGKSALVYDLGGGTFDVSVIRIGEEGTIDELAREGDVKLGGKEWDQEIVKRVDLAFEEEHGERLPPESNAYMTLSVEAEKAKKRLTDAEQARIMINHDGKRVTFKVTRDDFESWTSHHLARTEDTVNRTLRKANLTADQIDVCLPVGGSTKMPQVKEVLERLFPGKVDHTVDKDLVVAIGACYYMAKKLLEVPAPPPVPSGATGPEEPRDGPGVGRLPAETKEKLVGADVRQVSSRSYGIAVLKPDGSGDLYNDHFVRTDQSLPVTVKNKIYYTEVANQETAVVRLLEGDSEVVEECEPKAEQACQLPPNLPADSELHLTFIFTEEGMIRIKVTEPSSGVEEELEHQGKTMTPQEAQAVAGAIKATV